MPSSQQTPSTLILPVCSGETEAGLRLVLASPCPVVVWWGDELAAFANPAAGEIRWDEAILNEVRGVYATGCSKVVRSQRLTVSCSPIHDGGGRTAGVLGICTVEARAATSEERFQAVLAANSDIAYRMSADWTELRQISGKAVQGEVGTPDAGWMTAYILPEDRDAVSAAIAEAVRNKSPYELEHRVLRMEGTVGWVSSHAIPILDAAGEVQEWIGTARDITERKEAEKALVSLRRLYETILSTTPDLVYVFDRNHRFTYANRALLGMWGMTWEQAIGKNCLEIGYEPWHAEMHSREIETVVATKGPIRGEVPFTGTGGRRIYDYIFMPVFGPDGEVEAVAGTTRDVTERKQAEERLRDREERLRFMAESMPQKIFTALPGGEVDYLNAQWMEFSGWPVEELRGWRWVGLVHPEDAAEFSTNWRASIANGEPFQAVHRIRRADGMYRWHLSRVHPMRRQQGGHISMWIGSSTDIHEHKATEDALRQANQDLEQFAYTATHDLQEPLRSVIIYSEMLTRRHADRLDGPAQQYLEFLRDGAKRMEMLVRDLLSYTRAGLADEPAAPEDANVHLNAALANLKTAIEESGAVVDATELPSLPVHGAHLQQLFQNLIGNAIKYRSTERRPEISVAATRAGDHWLFQVRDNGIGIEPEYKERIFGLFKRLHTGDKYSGTGIGLAICQRIVERYQGNIWVESQPGRGSQFHFTLPV